MNQRGGVSAREYVLHIQIGDKTICGRVARKVNCKATDDVLHDLRHGGLKDDVCVVCRKNLEDARAEFKAREEAETARIAELIREVPTPCSNCRTVAHVTAEERGRGRWTCYSCGTINHWTK